MKKPACLGLALFNSSLKSFCFRQDLEKLNSIFSQSITHKERDFSFSKSCVFAVFYST
jgi:hypothetical protein